MTNYFIADTHFNHKNILKVRPQFATIEAMNRHMVEQWNSIVKPTDRVYHLGDVAMWKPWDLDAVRELKGEKILIRGNHDNYSEITYQCVGFKHTLAMKEFSGGIVCTHVPVHPQEMYRWRLNVHGHIHNQKVIQPVLDGATIIDTEDDPRYYCVSVEQINFKPVSLDEVKKKLPKQMVTLL